MSEALQSILKAFLLSLAMTIAFLGWLFILVRHRPLWLRWTAYEAAFEARIGIPKKLIEASRRFEESGKMIFFAGLMSVVFLVLTLIGACLSYRFHRFERSKLAFDAACAEFKAGNNPAAIRDFMMSIELDPQDPSGYSIRARAKTRIGDYHGALADCNRAIELDSKPSDINYSSRGLARLYLEDYPGAISDCEKAIQLNPQSSASYHNRGQAECYLTNYQAALSDLNKAIELDPNSPRSYNNRGYVKACLKDYPGAISDYSKAIELDPKYDMAYNNRGNAKRLLQNYRSAIADYDAAITISPHYAAAISNRNTAVKMLGNGKN